MRCAGYPGAQQCAENIRTLTAVPLLKRPGKKVQDAYSLRSCPQVVGAARDACKWSRYMLEIELNHAADNPVFFPDDDVVLTGANFQAHPWLSAWNCSVCPSPLHRCVVRAAS